MHIMLLECCRADRLVSVTLQLSRQSFAPGETVNLEGSKVTNTSTQSLPVTLRLQEQVIEMRTTRGLTVSCKYTYDLLTVTCPGNSKLTNEGLAVEIPAVFPSHNGSILGSPTHQHYPPCLRWTYVIEICVGAGSMGLIITGAVPILIASTPPFPHAIHQASSNVSVNPLMGPFSVLYQAVTGNMHCDTTPYISGPKDGGTIFNSQTGLWAGFIKTHTTPKENAQVGATNIFAPQVITFLGLVNEPGSTVQQEPADNNSNIPILSVEDNIVPLPSLAMLIREMEAAYGKRLAAGQWIQNHPREAIQFTPQEVGNILSALSFLLDQRAVASELCVGCSITCEHVVEAMKVCQYSKLDVAQTMAHFVADPEHKDIVLEHFKISFEQDQVAHCFCSYN